MPITLKDVAKRAGVSVPTVSLIMNGHNMPFRAETREAVRAAVESLGYRPDSMARRTGRAQHRRDAIGLLVRSESLSRVANTPAYEFICGINDVLMEQEQFLMLVKLKQLQEGQAGTQPRVIAERFVDGLIVETGLTPELEQAVSHYSIPTIWLNSDHHDPMDCVYPDEIYSSQTATQRLLDLGHRRILFLAPPTHLHPGAWHFSANDRRQGYVQAMNARGLKAEIVEEENVARTQITSVIQTIVESQQRPNPITGVVANGFSVGVKLRYQLQAAGVVCPQDVSIITPDDLHIMRRTFPEMTGISCERYEMGRCAAEMMLAKITTTRPQPSRVFKGSLIEGETVAPVAAPKRAVKRKGTQ